MEWLEVWLPGCLDRLAENRGTGLLAAVLVCSSLYLLYYLVFVVNKPRLYGGGARLMPHLLAHCPSLQQCYWPTLWALNCHVNTLARFVLQKDIDIQYHRTCLTMADGGEVGLDWGRRGGDKREESPEEAPILLILAGLTGSSSSTYIKYLVEDGLNSGYRPVVFNQRGTEGLLLKTHRIYCATKIDDLQHVLDFLHRSFPHSDLVAIGISLGGMLVTQYLHQVGPHSHLKAVMAISCPWDAHATGKSFEEKFINRQLYTKHLCGELKEFISRNTAALDKETLKHLPFDLDHVLQSTTISQIDERLICPLFGYRCLDDYYDAASNWNKIHKIATPFLCLSATDDPFVPASSLPLEGFSSNPHTLLVTTSSGGHFGFVEGLLPTSESWMNHVCREFLVAMTHY
jgi:abhydrolase domain-containing protein 1/3